MLPGCPSSHQEEAYACEERRKGHGADALTHYVNHRTPSPVDHGIRQAVSASQPPGGHNVVQEPVPRQHLCERATQNIQAQPYGEKLLNISQSSQSFHPGHISGLGNNHQQMSSEADRVSNSTADMFVTYRNFVKKNCQRNKRLSMVRVNGESGERSREHVVLHSLQDSSMNNNAALTSTQHSNPAVASCSSAVVQRATLSRKAQTTNSKQKRDSHKPVHQSPFLYSSLSKEPTDCNSNAIMDLNTGFSSSVSEETNLNHHLPVVTHCEDQQGTTSSQPPVLNYGQLRTNVLPQTSTQNINCTVTNTQHGPPPYVSSLPEPSTDKNSALEKNEILTDSQILEFIAERLNYFRNLAKMRNNREYGQSNSEEERTLRSSEEDPSHCLANQSNSKTVTLKATGDGLSSPGAKQSFTFDKEGYEEDSTKEDSANTLLTQKFKESDNCAKSTPVKCWESGTPIPAVENSSHPHEIKSADQKASLGFDSPVKKLSGVTVSLDSNCQVIDSNNCCENKTCNISKDESYNSEHCEKISKNVSPTVPILLYTSVALKELVASLENAQAPVVPRDNIRDFIIQRYWDGNIKKLCVFIATEYPQIMMDVAATCTKNEYESPVVLTAITGMTLDELVKKCPALSVGYTPSQEEYKSFWLNINERLDDLDKEPGVAWSLHFTLEKGGEDISLKAADAADMVDSIPNKTDIVFSAKQRVEEETVEESPTESLSPLKISVLSSDDARRIFYQHQSESNPQTMLERCENNLKGHASLPGNQNEQLTEVGPSQYEDVAEDSKSKLHLVLFGNKIEELSSPHEHQDVESSKRTDINDPKSDDDGSPQHGDMKADPKGQLSAPLNGNQTLKVASLSGNQREGQSNQINANDANPMDLQPEWRTRLPENGSQQQAGHKDEKPIFSSICKDPRYDDITDEDSQKYSDITDEDSPKYEDITDEEVSQTAQQNESIASLPENNCQKQALPCRNQGNGQKQVITDITSNNQALCRTEKDALKQTCCCPYVVETEDGFENRLCPTCEAEGELGKKTEDSTSYVSSPVFKGPDGNLVSTPVSGLFCPLSDDSTSSNQDTEEVLKEPVSQTDAKALDYKSAKTSQCGGVTKTEASLHEQGPDHGDPHHEQQFIDAEHEELMMDESPQNEETSVTGDNDFQYRDETEDDDDDWMVISVAVSDLIFEPTDGEHVSPKTFLPQHVENGEKQEDDESCRIIIPPRCEVPDSTSKPATASPSADIEVFESFARFREAKNVNSAHCPIFSPPEEDDILTRDQSPRSQILSSETESEPEDVGELYMPHKKRQASTSETDHSSDYSISAHEFNYLTVSKKCWEKRQRPKRFSASSMSDSEDEESDSMSNVSHRSPFPESDSESEDDVCINNVRKCLKRCPTTTEREDSSVESGCLITNRQSTDSKTGTDVIQCRSKRPKISNGKHMAKAESDSEIEQYSKKTLRRKRKLSCTESEDASVTSQKRHATELADNRRRDEDERSPQQAGLSSEMQPKDSSDDSSVLQRMQVEDSSDDSTVQQHHSVDSEREYTSAPPPVVPCVLEQASPGFTDSVQFSKESTVHKQATEKLKRVHSQHEKELSKTLEIQTALTKSKHSNFSQTGSLHKDGELRKPSCSKSLKRGDKGKESNKERSKKKERQMDQREDQSEEMREQRSLDRERGENLREENKKERKGGMGETEERMKLRDKREKDEQRKNEKRGSKSPPKTSQKKDSSHQKPEPKLVRDTKGRFSSHKKGPACGKRQKSKTSESEAQANSRKQKSTSSECPSTSKECLSTSKEGLSNSRQGSSPSRECISNSTEGLPFIECPSIARQGSSSRECLSKSREGLSSSGKHVSKSRDGPSTLGEVTASSTKSVSKSREGLPSSRECSSKPRDGSSMSRKALSSTRRSLSKSREGMSSSKEGSVSSREPISNCTEGSSSARESLSKLREGPSTSRKGSTVKSREDLSSKDCLSKSREGSRECLLKSSESPLTYRESVPSSREHLSKARKGSPSSTEGSPSSRECLSTSREGSSSRRESLSTSRDGSASLREHLSKSRERPSSEKHLSNSSHGSSSSRKRLSKSRKGPSSSREDSSSSTGLQSSRECLSKPKEGLSTSSPSSSLEGPSTSGHSPSTSREDLSPSINGLSGMTKARQQLLTQWQTTYYPTRRDRRTNNGTEEDYLRTSPPHSKYIPEKGHRDAEREARLGPRHYDRGPRQRHSSQESATPLMKKSMDQAKLWTKAIHREAPHESRQSVGEGYKWKDRRHSCETKGSSRERMDCGSPPEPYY